MAAIAGFTFTQNARGRQRIGRQTHVTGRLTPVDDGDWTAGGFALTASQFGLNRLDDVRFHGAAINGTGATLGSLPAWDATAGKFTCFEANTADAELVESDLTAMSGYEFHVTAIGS